jgi:hypothetical protein
MTLYLREVGNDVAFYLEGSINTSVFNGPPANATTGGTGTFSHGGFQRTAGDGSWAFGVRAFVMSGSVNGDQYFFANDAAMTTVGTPRLQGKSNFLNTRPPFWFGFEDLTQMAGTPGRFRDEVYVPDGYTSNDFISLDFIERNNTFATLGLALGDRWGVSFTDGAGGTQSIIFHAIPEPSTFGVALLSALHLLLAVRSSKQRRGVRNKIA